MTKDEQLKQLTPTELAQYAKNGGYMPWTVPSRTVCVGDPCSAYKTSPIKRL